MTLVGQVFIVAVVVVALMQSAVGLEAFKTNGALDLPLFENINNTLRF
jgi:hypothetical protein